MNATIYAPHSTDKERQASSYPPKRGLISLFLVVTLGLAADPGYCALESISTGADLLNACKEYLALQDGQKTMTMRQVVMARQCDAWLQGLDEGHRSTAAVLAIALGYASKTKPGAPITKLNAYCLPMQTAHGETTALVTYEQMTSVVVKYLENHPVDLHLAAGSLALHALSDAFPCSDAAVQYFAKPAMK
jgi:hypothetical protein